MAEGIDLARVLVGLAMKSSGIVLCPCPIVGALSNDACLRSVCLSVCLSCTSGLSREQKGLGKA